MVLEPRSESLLGAIRPGERFRRRRVTRTTGTRRWLVMLATVSGLALLPVLGVGSATAGPQGSGDLQWAQQVLKEKGFDPGHPNGEMTSKTRAALSAYQRSVGLPATGALDEATTSRLMAGHTASPTMGNLAAPSAHAHDGHGPNGHDAVAPAPHAVSSGRVEASGGGGDVMVFGAGSASSSSGGPPRAASGGTGGVPRAAPSGTVTAVATPSLSPSSPSPSSSSPGDTAASPEPEGPSFAVVAPAWLRDAVVGVIAVILGGFAGLWWWSGRRRPAHRGPPLSVEVTGPARIEPRFGTADRRHPIKRELRAERF
jgi:hypothetical protein